MEGHFTEKKSDTVSWVQTPHTSKPQHAWRRWRIVRLDDESDRKILECKKENWTFFGLNHKDIYWLMKLEVQVQGGLPSSLWLRCIFSFTHSLTYPAGCLFHGVASCSGGYGEAAAVTTHIYTWWPRQGASGSSFQKMEGGLCHFLSLLVLSVFSKQQPKQSC